MRIDFFIHVTSVNQSQRSHLCFVTQIGISVLTVQTMTEYLPVSYLCSYEGWGIRKKANRKQTSVFLLVENAKLCQYFLSHLQSRRKRKTHIAI